MLQQPGQAVKVRKGKDLSVVTSLPARLLPCRPGLAPRDAATALGAGVDAGLSGPVPSSPSPLPSSSGSSPLPSFHGSGRLDGLVTFVSRDAPGDGDGDGDGDGEDRPTKRLRPLGPTPSVGILYYLSACDFRTGAEVFLLLFANYFLTID